MSSLTECLILVDNSNIFIEGMKFSVGKKGIHAISPDQTTPCDYSWRIDFGALLKQVANGYKIIQAALAGSTPPPNDSLREAAESQGFEVTTYERGFSGEKAIDTELVVCGLKIIYKHPVAAVLKLLSGDRRDFIPLLKAAYEERWETELWGFSDSISPELSVIANRTQILDSVFDQIGKYQS